MLDFYAVTFYAVFTVSKRLTDCAKDHYHAKAQSKSSPCTWEIKIAFPAVLPTAKLLKKSR